ncbi:MAG: hypothetical protein WCI55_08045 [Armatimonadota bacterium]
MSLNSDKLNGIDFTPTPRTDRAWARGRMIVCPKCSNRKQLFELIYNPKGEQLCEKCGGKFSSHFTPSDSHLKKMNREKEQK